MTKRNISTELLTQITAEVAKAYRLAHRDVPKAGDLQTEAMMIITDTDCIPMAYIARCYAYARVHGRSSVPTSKDVVNAWYSEIKAEHVKEANSMAIEYRPSHSCRYCPVVALRLGLEVPDATDEERRVAAEPITRDELLCVGSTTIKDSTLHRFWNESQSSPYRGML